MVEVGTRKRSEPDREFYRLQWGDLHPLDGMRRYAERIQGSAYTDPAFRNTPLGALEYGLNVVTRGIFLTLVHATPYVATAMTVVHSLTD